MSSSVDTMDIPEEYICPISYGIMTDPVSTSDGQSYNRPELMEWLKVRQISPLTNEPVSPSSVVSNFALRAAIQRFLAANTTIPADAKRPPTTQAKAKSFTVECQVDSDLASISCNVDEPMETIVILTKDNSGSMAGTAARERSKEGGDFSRLDLVKHAGRTVASMLAERYTTTPTYLAVQTFSSNAKVVSPLRPMTQANLPSTLDAINSIQPEGMTNLWDGLRLALDTAARAARLHPNANIHVMLLTDGEPSDCFNPPQGILTSLERKLKACGENLTLSVFGFGYQLDSVLLRNICEQGGGTFGYIPDCSMVGTVFINTVSTILSTVARNIRVEESPAVYQHLPGVLTVGQRRFFRMNSLNRKTASPTIRIKYDNDQETTVDVRLTPSSSESKGFEMGVLRLSEILTRYLNGSAEKQWLIERGMELYDELKKNADAGGALALARDISSREPHEGQIMKALSRDDWLTEWGINHFIGYLRALTLQQCCNFKDAAPQLFMGPLNKDIREMGSTIFDNLEPPKPSLAWSYGGSGGAATPVAMNFFNNAAGGCWAGWCKVRLADDTFCYTHEIQRGYMLWGGHKVLCVIETEYDAPISLCNFNGLAITPWHPLRSVVDKTQKWRFPADLVSGGLGHGSREFIHTTYNLVLESGHIAQVGDYQVATLGHYMEGDVIGHPYFGTYKVIDDLKNQPYWECGRIKLRPDQWIRGEDGLVCGLRNGPRR